ncbi:sensor histidine kinase [Geobacter pickeringii]|uniref:histidine kinase n=1 Tax=Geobacter pickeringii TaxID=345632 RepID=A0A0B5BFR7_9BACT|nr:HAMP domain-containing sensor histidine kinase [Geobacter pickeringii]AJE02891.1 histidine kinase [Geobacter pickeringii]
MKQFRFSLGFLILSSLSFLLILTWVLLSLISFRTAENDILQQKGEKARLLLSSFVTLLPPSLADTPASSAAVLARRLAGEKEFIGILVVGKDGAPLFALGEAGGGDGRLRELLAGGGVVSVTEDKGRLSGYAPVMRDGAVAGAARLVLSLAGEKRLLGQSRHLFLAYFVLDFVLLLAVGSLLLSRFIVAPVRRLLAATERLRAGDFSHRAVVPGGREIAELAESFNAMVVELRQRREEADRYVATLERANRELQVAREETIRSEKMASVGLLAAGTAHEVGTPLAAIMGYAALLREELSGDAEKEDYLRRIVQDAERIDRIVRDLLDFARPVTAPDQEIDVAPLIASTVEMLSRQGLFKQVEVSVETPEGLPRPAVEPGRFQQVLINLIINARDAMAGGGRLEIRALAGMFTPLPELPLPAAPPAVGGRRKGDFGGAFRTPFAVGGAEIRCVRVEVADTGEGIPAEWLARIFDPFFTTKEPGRGTGLGLAISARIIDSFGGRITVESTPGQGSRFIVWLPAPPELQPHGEQDDE